MVKVKRFLILFCILLLASSCSNNSSLAIDKLNQKYDKKFVVKEEYPRKIGQDYFDLLVYPEDEPDLLFTASFDTKDEFFSDNYVEKHICKQISETIYDNLGVKDNIYIFTSAIGPQPVTNDIGQTIKEYADLDNKNKFKSSIFITNEFDGLYDREILFLNLGFLDISADIYVVEEKQLQEVKDFMLDNGNTKSMDYLDLIKDLTVRSV